MYNYPDPDKPEPKGKKFFTGLQDKRDCFYCYPVDQNLTLFREGFITKSMNI